MPYNIVYADEPTYLDTAFISELSRRGSVKLYFDRPSPAELRERLSDADIAISEWSHFTADSMPRGGRLKHIALLLSGLDTVDLAAAAAAGVSVSNCPRYCVDAVADHVVACAYALARRMPAATRAGMAGLSHVYTPFLGRELRGSTIGLIGVGRIGQAVAERASRIGLRIIGCNRSGRPAPGIELMPIEQVVSESDIVSVQLPYNDETHGILNARLISRARSDSLWINIGRFKLFCEASLAEVLREQRIGGIALDECPYRMLGPVHAHGNAMVTPGTAWYTARSREQNLREVLENIDRIAAGGEHVAS
jgi:glycerate dehydrogenase